MQTVVITGGTKGIGLAITQAFVDSGANVIVASRTKSKEIEALGDNVGFFAIDVRDRAAHSNLIDFAREKTGKVDVLINNAGVSQWRPISDIDEEFVQLIMNSNFHGTLWGSQAAAAVMESGASILNISSLAGKRGSANNSLYCASKFAINGLTQSLAKELGPRGIRVNALCPVYVTTDTILESLEDQKSPAGGQAVQEYLTKFTNEQTALKRLPTGKNIAETCLFLCSPAAEAITGQCINIDCGVLPQ